MKYQWTPGWTKGTECYESLELWSLFAGGGACSPALGGNYASCSPGQLIQLHAMISEQILNKDAESFHFIPSLSESGVICWFVASYWKWKPRMILNIPCLDDAVVHCVILQLLKLRLRCPDMFGGVSEGTPRAWAREGQKHGLDSWRAVFIKHYAVCKEDW